MNFETLIVESWSPVTVVRFNRPRQRNALSTQSLRDLMAVVNRVAADDDIRVLVFTGNEQAFSSGQDLKEEPAPTYILEINELFNTIEALPKPTIAAIDGWCLAGGLELALACDIRIAAETAKIGDWHVRINSIGGAGATTRLTRLLGIAKAKELIFTGAALSGAEAAAFGLVNRVCPPGEHLTAALELANEIAEKHPLTLRYAKESIHAAMDQDVQQALFFSLQRQAELQKQFKFEGSRNKDGSSN